MKLSTSMVLKVASIGIENPISASMAPVTVKLVKVASVGVVLPIWALLMVEKVALAAVRVSVEEL